MSEQENLDLVRGQLEAANAGDVQRYAACFAEDAVLESDAWPVPLEGRAAAEAMLQGYIDAFGPSFEIQQEIASGDDVVTVYSYSGTHHGEFAGIAPTGNPVTGRVVSISTVANGQIQRQLTLFDNATLLAQVGVDLPTSVEATG